MDQKSSTGLGGQHSDTRAGTQPGLGTPTPGISAITPGSDANFTSACVYVCVHGDCSICLSWSLFLLVSISLCLD